MLNQVQLIGFTGAGVEVRESKSGKKFATLRVATGHYTSKGASPKDTTWHTVEIWSEPVLDWIANHGLSKGAKVFVQGEIRHDRYTDRNDQERVATKVVVGAARHELRLLERTDSATPNEV